MLQKPVYLDYAATSPVHSQVAAAMLPYFEAEFGNPASVHRLGQQADQAVEAARSTIAADLGCDPHQIVFTSGGSESDNLALRGAALAGRELRNANHILTTPVEHDAVLVTARQLADLHGFELELLPVDSLGRVDPEDLSRRIRDDTALVSVIYGNNEIGTLNPVRQLARRCNERGVIFHTDAVQATSQLKLNVEDLQVDMLSMAAHKMYGPKGVGALYVRDRHAILPAQTGGLQESGLRSGTSNVPLIVGMAESVRIASERREIDASRFQVLRNRLIEDILAAVPRARLTGHPESRLPNHASFVFEGVDGNQLLAALDLAGYACSSGSACKTGDPEPSKVLLALGLDPQLSLGSLRVTVGRQTDQHDIDSFLDTLPQVIERLRSSNTVLV